MYNAFSFIEFSFVGDRVKLSTDLSEDWEMPKGLDIEGKVHLGMFIKELSGGASFNFHRIEIKQFWEWCMENCTPYPGFSKPYYRKGRLIRFMFHKEADGE